jgi:hypothetical protein
MELSTTPFTFSNLNFLEFNKTLMNLMNAIAIKLYLKSFCLPVI